METRTVILQTKDGWEKKMAIPKGQPFYRLAITRPFSTLFGDSTYKVVDFEPTGEVIEIWRER